MRSATVLAAFVSVVVTGVWSAPLDLKGKTLKETFEELLPGLDKQDAQQKWQAICLQLGAPGNETRRPQGLQADGGQTGPSDTRCRPGLVAEAAGVHWPGGVH